MVGKFGIKLFVLSQESQIQSIDFSAEEDSMQGSTIEGSRKRRSEEGNGVREKLIIT